MRSYVFIFLFTQVVFANAVQAAVCLRFPNTSFSATSSDGCEDTLGNLERESRATTLLRDYDDFLLAQERNPKKAWREFLQKALKKNWSPEDERIMREVGQWVRNQGWKLDPQLVAQVELLVRGEDLELRPRPGHDTWLEKIAKLPGYEDVRVLAPAMAQETESSVLSSAIPRRFVVYSSVYRPRAFWAKASELPALIHQPAIAWVDGDCLNPRFNGLHSDRFEIRAYGVNGCSTANLARIAMGAAGPAPTAIPLGMNREPELKKADRTHWVLLGLLAGAAAAYSLRDKTVVITHGFGR